MASFGFSLADRLGAKTHPCSVAGCTRTWLAMSGKGLKLGGRPGPDPADPTSSMCDPCREKVARLSEAPRPCDRPGCQGTWLWPVKAQLEAFATHRTPPRSLCEACEERLAGLQDREIPCTVPGCTRTSVFTRRAQLLAGAPQVDAKPEIAMCGPCDQVSRKLKDRPVGCGINGCRRKWTWTADEQIQAFATGKPNEPPRRMCDESQTEFGGIADREIKCRTSGCKKTWTWARGDQLDACTSGAPAPKAAARMCGDCVALFSQLKDVERPCRRSTCKRTWTDKRGAQLARAVRGKTGDPYPRYCAECEKEVGELEDRQIACKTDNCEGTWTWIAAAQLAAGVRPSRAEPDQAPAEPEAGVKNAPAEPDRAAAKPEVAAPPASQSAARGQPGARRQRSKKRVPRPPQRHCESCSEFLSSRKTQEIPCTRCQTPIYWPPESQLQTHIGNWAAPSLCGACKRDTIEAARAIEREALRHPTTPAAEPAPEPEPAAPPADESAAPQSDSHTAGGT